MRKIKIFLCFALLTAITVRAYAQPESLLKQIVLIIALGEADHFKSMKADLVSTNSDGSKTFTFPLPLEGFKITMVQNARGKSVEATSLSFKDAYLPVSFLTDETMRAYNGMPYYKGTDYKTANPLGLEMYKSVMEYTKEGAVTKVRLYEMTDRKGYLLKIIPY